MRMAGEVIRDALTRAKELAEVALVADLIKGGNFVHGQKLHGGPGELLREARERISENPLAVRTTPLALREAVAEILDQRLTMIQDDIGVNYDAIGAPIPEDERYI